LIRSELSREADILNALTFLGFFACRNGAERWISKAARFYPSKRNGFLFEAVIGFLLSYIRSGKCRLCNDAARASSSGRVSRVSLPTAPFVAVFE
jgi:hypothetical protein